MSCEVAALRASSQEAYLLSVYDAPSWLATCRRSPPLPPAKTKDLWSASSANPWWWHSQGAPAQPSALQEGQLPKLVSCFPSFIFCSTSPMMHPDPASTSGRRECRQFYLAIRLCGARPRPTVIVSTGIRHLNHGMPLSSCAHGFCLPLRI